MEKQRNKRGRARVLQPTFNQLLSIIQRPLSIQVSYLEKNGKNIEINWVLKV